MVGGRWFSTLVILAFVLSMPGIAADPAGNRNIRLKHREPGLYLAPLEDPAHPEDHNFTTTQEPLATLNADEMADVLRKHPDLKNYRVVIIGPPVTGDVASHYKEFAERTLTEAGVENPNVQIIRHPQGIYEHLTNVLPRWEDYEAPLKSELKVAAFKIVLAEGLSFAALLIPPWIKGTPMDPALAEIIDKIALPFHVAIPMVVLDIANMIPLISYRRALSNHNIRLNPLERFERQFLMGMFFSFGFYMTSRWETFWSALTDVGPMLSLIVPASLFNMMARTTVSTSLNIWEQRAPDRRFWTTVMETVTGLVIAPLYIFSTMPILEKVIHTPVMDLTAAHLGLLGIGGAGGVAWMTLEKSAVKRFFTESVPSCAKKLVSAVSWLWRKDSP